MAKRTKTLIVAAGNSGTINGKKTTTLPADIDAAVNKLDLDIQSVLVCPAGNQFPDQMLVIVVHESKEEDKKNSGKK